MCNAYSFPVVDMRRTWPPRYRHNRMNKFVPWMFVLQHTLNIITRFGPRGTIIRKPNRSIWCDFDRASSLMCGNKMPTRCNRGFYCRSYCLLNVFRAPLCPSSGAQEYYTVVAACGISCCDFQVAGLVWSWGLCVRFAGANNKICNKNLCCI